MNELLNILENNSRLSAEKIAVMLDMKSEEVEAVIKKYEEERIIMGYKTLVNWEKTDAEKVTAFIELKVTPQFEQGFDAIAAKIYKYEQVKSISTPR